MKCQKCAKQAVVHLTEVVGDNGAGEGMGGEANKRAVEIHLCLNHAVEAGLIVPTPDVPPQVLAMQPPKVDVGSEAPDQLPTAIVPAPPQPSGLTVVRSAKSGDGTVCPVCGTDWNQFKQTGVMGCAHDYELFVNKMLPLLKRAQEGATEHVGKMPARRKTRDVERQVTTSRLRRELQRAIDAEKYEEAAELRDQLRQLEQN